MIEDRITQAPFGCSSSWEFGCNRIPKLALTRLVVQFDVGLRLGLRMLVPSIVGKRVVIVLGPLELGGSERQALLFARYLKERHADVRVWGTMGVPGRLAALCDDYAIPWRIVSEPWVDGRGRRLKTLKEFASKLRRARVDILLPYMEIDRKSTRL